MSEQPPPPPEEPQRKLDQSEIDGLLASFFDDERRTPATPARGGASIPGNGQTAADV